MLRDWSMSDSQDPQWYWSWPAKDSCTAHLWSKGQGGDQQFGASRQIYGFQTSNSRFDVFLLVQLFFEKMWWLTWPSSWQIIPCIFSWTNRLKRVVNLQSCAPIIKSLVDFYSGDQMSDQPDHQSTIRISAEATLPKGEEESRFHRWRVRISDGETIGPDMRRRDDTHVIKGKISQSLISGHYYNCVLAHVTMNLLCVCRYAHSNVGYVYLRYSPYTWMIYARLSSPLTCSMQEPKKHQKTRAGCVCVY